MTTEEAIEIFEVWAECNYKSTHDAAVMAISALRAQQQAEANHPLTLDELRQMEGEPVYIAENAEYLAVVNGFDERGMYLLSSGNLDDYGSFKLYGKTWLAYRHKPKEA